MTNFVMKVKKLEEAGRFPALWGLMMNKHRDVEKNLGTLTKMEKLAIKLSNKDAGHNKFLEHMIVWLEVKAPRYFWQEADTYRLSSKQSEGTRDILRKQKGFTQDNFENPLPQNYIDFLNEEYATKNEVLWKSRMPEGYLQTREWMLSYKTLRNIITQRRKHPLPHWKSFCEQIIELVRYPELLPEVN